MRMTVSAVAIAALFSGCSSASTNSGNSAGGPTGSSLWVGTATDVPGLESGHVSYVGKLIVVWAADGTGGGGNMSGDAEGIRGDGLITFRTGQKSSYTYRIPKKNSGVAVFEGVEYQLAAGRVFLLKVVNGKVTVKQHDKDVSGIDFPAADFPAIGRADPAIREFFGK